MRQTSEHYTIITLFTYKGKVAQQKTRKTAVTIVQHFMCGGGGAEV